MFNQQKEKIFNFIKSKFPKVFQFIKTFKNKFPKVDQSKYIKSHKRIIVLLSILFVTIIITILSVFKFKVFPSNFSFKDIFKIGTRIFPTPRPSPRPIPHGIKSFVVSQSDKTVPQFSKGTIDPYDPIKDSNQIITISVKHKKPVSNVTAMYKTDNTVVGPVSLNLISGTNTNGEWQGSIQISDTYLYTYILVLQAEDEKGTIGTVEIPLR